MDDAELTGLLRHARGANASVGLTGVLLHVDGSFFQVLEGEPAVLDTVFRKIEADPRHCDLVSIIREPIRARAFADWTMGFASLSMTELQAITGTNDFFGDSSVLSRLGQGRAKKLLTAFAAGRWRSRVGAPVAAAG